MQRVGAFVSAVSVLLVAACGTGTIVDTPDSVTGPAPGFSASTTTWTEPSTTAGATTTTADGPVTRLLRGPLLVANRVGPEGSSMRLTAPDGSVAAELTTDRHWPTVDNVTGDGSGGILAVASPPPFPAGAVIHLAAGAVEPGLWYAPDDGWRVLDLGVVKSGDAPVLVVSEGSWDDRKEGDRDVLAWSKRVRVIPSGGPPQSIAEASGETWFLGTEGETSGGDIGNISVGGGLISVVRHGVEFFDAAGAPVILPNNPAPAGGGSSLERAELSADGSLLVVRDRSPADGQARLAVYRLADGAQLGSITGVWDHFYDGNRTVLARTADDRVLLGTITDGGLATSRLPIDSPEWWPVAVLSDIRLADGAAWSVAGAEVDCSAAGMVPGTPGIGDLPGPVAVTRARIVRLAVACDFAALADLAAADPTFSLDEQLCTEPRTIADVNPVGLWYRADLEGDKLRVLVEVLAGEPRLVTWGESAEPVYVWGGDGYQTGIAPDGTWFFDTLAPVKQCETIWCTC